MKNVLSALLILCSYQLAAQPRKGDVFINSSFGYTSESENQFDRTYTYLNPNIGRYFSQYFAISLGYDYQISKEDILIPINNGGISENRKYTIEEADRLLNISLSIQPKIIPKLRSRINFGVSFGSTKISQRSSSIKLSRFELNMGAGFIYFPTRRMGIYTELGGFFFELAEFDEEYEGNNSFFIEEYSYESIGIGFNPSGLLIGVQFTLNGPKRAEDK